MKNGEILCQQLRDIAVLAGFLLLGFLLGLDRRAVDQRDAEIARLRAALTMQDK